MHKPLWEWVDCAELGYAATSARVMVNPPDKMVNAYWDAMGRMADANADEADRQAAEADFEGVVVQLVPELFLEGDSFLLRTRDDLREIDPQIVSLALYELWEMRRQRLDKAKSSFRERTSGLPVSADGGAAG
jgi:hypothetical protein